MGVAVVWDGWVVGCANAYPLNPTPVAYAAPRSDDVQL